MKQGFIVPEKKKKKPPKTNPTVVWVLQQIKANERRDWYFKKEEGEEEEEKNGRGEFHKSKVKKKEKMQLDQKNKYPGMTISSLWFTILTFSA